MNRIEALGVVALLGVAHNGRALTEEQVSAFADGIGNLDFEAARLAAVMHAQSQTWMPSLGEFREAVLRPDIPDAAQAWGAALAEVHHAGWAGTPTFSHPAVSETVRLMGWRSICEQDEVAARAHFVRLYGDVRERYRRLALMDPQVVGAFEMRWQETRGLDRSAAGELGDAEG